MAINLDNMSVFIDTNVWMYYFLGDAQRCADIVAMFTALAEKEAFVATNSLAAKDVFYLVQRALKRKAADDAFADEASIKAAAWSCIQQISHLAFITNLGMSEYLEACIFKDKHSDFEDNLMVASASPYDFFITYDSQLAKHVGRQALTPRELLKLI